MVEPVEPSTENPRLVFLHQLLDDLRTDAERRHRCRLDGTPLGAMTPWSKLNEAIGGSLMPGLHIVNGGTGSGKTAFCLQIASTCGCPALYVSREIGTVEILRRLAARASKTYLGKFKDGSLTADTVIEAAKRAVDAYPDLAIADATKHPAPSSWIEETGRTIKTGEHMLIVIDSLHAWADFQIDAQDEYSRINAACSALQTMASRLDVPIIAIAERNRASKDGGISSGAGSRKIEYGSETVISIDKSDEPKTANGIPIKVTIDKNRHGDAGKPIDMYFHGATQTFSQR